MKTIDFYTLFIYNKNTKERTNMDINELEVRITELINKYLDGWHWKWSRATRQYGCCYNNSHLITISKPLAKINPWKQTQDTILHEIAHALAGPQHGHDKTWKSICLEIGAKPERCFSANQVILPPPKYYAICPDCGKTHFANRKTKVRHSCGRCSNGRFNPDYVLEFEPNPLSNPKEA